jgi:hypothetical protein
MAGAQIPQLSLQQYSSEAQVLAPHFDGWQTGTQAISMQNLLGGQGGHSTWQPGGRSWLVICRVLSSTGPSSPQPQRNSAQTNPLKTNTLRMFPPRGWAARQRRD